MSEIEWWSWFLTSTWNPLNPKNIASSVFLSMRFGLFNLLFHHPLKNNEAANCLVLFNLNLIPCIMGWNHNWFRYLISYKRVEYCKESNFTQKRVYHLIMLFRLRRNDFKKVFSFQGPEFAVQISCFYGSRSFTRVKKSQLAENSSRSDSINNSFLVHDK